MWFSPRLARPEWQHRLGSGLETINTLTINDTSPVTVKSDTNLLTIAGSVTVANGEAFATLNANIALTNANPIVTVNSANGLTMGGVVGGSNGLTRVVLAFTHSEQRNSYSGDTTVSGGTLKLTASALSPSSTAARASEMARSLAIDDGAESDRQARASRSPARLANWT